MFRYKYFSTAQNTIKLFSFNPQPDAFSVLVSHVLVGVLLVFLFFIVGINIYLALLLYHQQKAVKTSVINCLSYYMIYHRMVEKIFVKIYIRRKKRENMKIDNNRENILETNLKHSYPMDGWTALKSVLSLNQLEL